ncbi:MAG: heavy metal transporter [Kordiimonas sp.]|uniref:heavy-metal-associated domain-containing protein n=1 Tax=Kordiimonas sp. TaxID=1970157 RepID=UPI000C679AE1|nr:heavy metal transporter [Kordiimonas sp.]
MKHLIKTCAVALVLGMALPITATFADEAKPATQQTAEKTVTFEIEKMTCAMCPITVRKAMEKVNGVASVKTDYDKRTAVVVFDPAKANIEDIAKASENAGYPAILKDEQGS